jgi:hypothetical protein
MITPDGKHYIIDKKVIGDTSDGSMRSEWPQNTLKKEENAKDKEHNLEQETRGNN